MISLLYGTAAISRGLSLVSRTDYASLAPMLLEEAYEAFEAVELAREGNADLARRTRRSAFSNHFLRPVAKERSDFTIDDVTTNIHDKMVRRHPHVSPMRVPTACRSTKKLGSNQKPRETRRPTTGDNEHSSLLDRVSTKVPALMEAHSSRRKPRVSVSTGKFGRHLCEAG